MVRGAEPARLTQHSTPDSPLHSRLHLFNTWQSGGRNQSRDRDRDAELWTSCPALSPSPRGHPDLWAELGGNGASCLPVTAHGKFLTWHKVNSLFTLRRIVGLWDCGTLGLTYKAPLLLLHKALKEARYLACVGTTNRPVDVGSGRSYLAPSGFFLMHHTLSGWRTSAWHECL